ncbi:hypothetical protein BC834DRAFT_972479 [Gloeopeniophorella convolvens]|nr:hypothetical protein BC834DRAFT_972479 [Gloeopeniophorella convolvens]
MAGQNRLGRDSSPDSPKPSTAKDFWSEEAKFLPTITFPKPKKSARKEKAVSFNAAPDVSARDEAPTPPRVCTTRRERPSGLDIEFGEFDYDSVKSSGAELWLVRIPASIKPKYLQEMEVASHMGLAGSLQRKATAYDVWTRSPQDPVAWEGRRNSPGSPTPVTRHVVLTARPPQPHAPDAAGSAVLRQNPPREAYPESVLKHRFRPYGDPGDAPSDADAMDVEAEVDEARPKEKEKRKRKGETDSPKKAKKAKTAATGT